MSKNPVASKIAAPYARALYDYSVEQNIMHQITADFQNLEVFFSKNSRFNRIFKQSFNCFSTKTRTFKTNVRKRTK